MNIIAYSHQGVSMKTLQRLFLLNSILLLSLFEPATASDRNIVGLWQGTLSSQGMELRVVFHVEKDSNGTLNATMDSPDQGAKGIVVDKVTVRGDSIALEVKMIGGGYYGSIQPGDSAMNGMWKQRGASLPLELHTIREVAVIHHPQEPTPPLPYTSEDVSYRNEEAGITLAGTFTKPNSGGPFPALLLITGSGPQNRDEELLGQKPFLVIADYLTRRGIAVLRVDDRGVGKSTGNFGTATTIDFAGDVRSGIKFLTTRSDVNPRKIGLLGHSEGGMIAPMVANQSSDVAYIVLLAGPSLRGDQILYLQSSLISAAMGLPAERISHNLRLNHALFAIVASESDTAKLVAKIRSAVEQSMSEDTVMGGKVNEQEAEMTAREISSPWFRFFLTYDPAPALEKVMCPVLALNGSKDLQVPAEEDIKGMEAAFKKSGNQHARAMVLPGLNHLFQKAETGLPQEYAKIEETVNPEALKIIGDWIEETVK
jgi:uncharacterized protein